MPQNAKLVPTLVRPKLVSPNEDCAVRLMARPLALAPLILAPLILAFLILAFLTSSSFAQSAEELPKPVQDPNQLRITQSIQKSELHMDRDVSSEKSKGRFTLVLEKALESKLQILPSQTQELLGRSEAQWRIQSENFSQEIVMTLQSKPDSRWKISCAVQIPSVPQGPLVDLAPKDPESVLRRLKAYDHWLKNTVDQWKFSSEISTNMARPSYTARPNHTSGPNHSARPTNFQTARSYAARQKETERSLERWTQIEQLAAQVFHAARVEFELTPVKIEAP